MKRYWSSPPFIAVLLVALVVLGALLLPRSAVNGASSGREAAPIQITRLQSGPDTLFGPFIGEVKLDATVLGVYTNPLATPTRQPTLTPAPPDLGAIDLALQLSQIGNQVIGFVDLEHTLVFTKETTIMATPIGPTPLPGTPLPGASPLPIGPRVSGALIGDTLQLESERVLGVIAGVPIQRQFRLSGVVTWGEDVVTMSGEYRETIWGYVPQPLTVIGRFTLRQALFNKDAGLTITPTPGATRTATRVVTAVPSATWTPSITSTPTTVVTAVPSATWTPSITSTSTPLPTNTPTTAASVTPSATRTPDATSTSSPLPTSTPTAVVTAVPSVTNTSEASTPTPTVSVTPSATRTPEYKLYLPLVWRRH